MTIIGHSPFKKSNHYHIKVLTCNFCYCSKINKIVFAIYILESDLQVELFYILLYFYIILENINFDVYDMFQL